MHRGTRRWIGTGCGRPFGLVWVFLLGVSGVLSGCGDGGSARKEAGSGQGSPATAPLDYLAAQGQAKKHSEKVVSLAQVQQALQQFQVAEDRWPRDLQELVKAGFLAAVPEVPAGQVLVYDAKAGTVRVARAAR